MSAVIMTGAVLAVAVSLPAAQKVRIGDITKVVNIGENKIRGAGLVVGLNGTGDQAASTRQLLASVYASQSINIDASSIQAKNVAAVWVEATLPDDAKFGSKVDVFVSSMADATSLLGGYLIDAPLYGPDNLVYARASGPVVVGGYSVGGEAASIQRNHTTLGRVPGGAVIAEEVPSEGVVSDAGFISLALRDPSYTTAQRIADEINTVFPRAARAQDQWSLVVRIPPPYGRHDLVPFMSRIDGLLVEPDARARIVISERTGIIVAGQHVRISTVAISRGNLTFSITETPEVSQPNPWSKGGRTEVVPRTSVEATEENSDVLVLTEGVSVAEVAEALNALGLSPRDLIEIFQALALAGALHAEIVQL